MDDIRWEVTKSSNMFYSSASSFLGLTFRRFRQKKKLNTLRGEIKKPFVAMKLVLKLKMTLIKNRKSNYQIGEYFAHKVIINFYPLL